MQKSRKYITLLLLTIIGWLTPMHAQVREEALDSILPKYHAWGAAELSVKLHTAGLPLSPTLKIYMKKGTDIDISVRASFLGEVGRLTLSNDSILAVNKMKKVYVCESLSGIKYDYPDIIDNIQSFLLGRVIVMKAGELAARNADFLDFTEVVDNDSILSEIKRWSLTFPKGRSETDEFGYEYIVNSNAQIESLALDASQIDLSLRMECSNSGYRRDADILIRLREDKNFEAYLEFEPTKWGVQAPEPMVITDKYRQVNFQQFMNSF